MLQVGQQVILGNGLWAIVEEVDGQEAWAVDKDGQDHVIDANGNGLHHIYPFKMEC